MNITDIKKQIKAKSLDSLYIFTGEEIEIQNIYINKIAETIGLQVNRAGSLLEIWDVITRQTLFGDKRVYVIRDDKDVIINDTLQKRLHEGDFNGNIIILLMTSVDKRSKFYKSFSPRIVVFERLSAPVICKHIAGMIPLKNGNCERLAAICENDYSRILLEIDKIKRYNPNDVDKAFETLVNEGVIASPPKDAIFDLVDAILRRQVEQVYNLLEQCYAVGEANMVILSVLYSNAKQVLQVQCCESDNIAESTGLTSWQIKCAKARCGYYRPGELVNIMRQIQRIQKGIISGQIEDYLSVEYLLVNVL